jgi:CRP-like cAMP-binding protein
MSHEANKNQFLSSLSSTACDLLVSASTPVSLPLKTILYEAEQVPAYAYFMTSGIASVVTAMADGGTAEVGLIGSEGLVGSMHLLGPAPGFTSCFIQLEATALRIPFPKLQKAFHASEEIRDRILEFVQTQALSLAQLAGCHRLHEAEERLARWLLMAQDRVQSNDLNFTQEFLAMMLGARRTTVTMVAGALQRSGLIEYRRGRVKILNRESLEAAACDCYRVTQQLYFNLYKQMVGESRG